MNWYYTLLLKLGESLARWAARKQYEVSKDKLNKARKVGLLLVVLGLALQGCSSLPSWMDEVYVETYEAE